MAPRLKNLILFVQGVLKSFHFLLSWGVPIAPRFMFFDESSYCFVSEVPSLCCFGGLWFSRGGVVFSLSVYLKGCLYV